jgi:hypothetical protein
LIPSNDALVVDGPGSFHLDPGEGQVRAVYWTPVVESDALEARIDAIVVDLLPATAAVGVTGRPAFGDMYVWGDSLHLGSVSIGCDRDFWFHIENLGSGELSLESVTLSGSDEFALEAADCEPAARVLAPNESAIFHGTFTPTDPVDAEAMLQIVSDDFSSPVVDTQVTGLGIGDGSPGTVSLWYPVSPRPTALTSLIDVNAEVAPGILSALDSFFEVLRASKLPFRVAIIGGQGDPSVAGPYAYIDDTFSDEQSHWTVKAMLDGIEGDEDAGLALLDAALEEHRDWLIDEDSIWQSSMLHLTVVNVDAEQSPSPAEYYVGDYAKQKGDAALVAVDGIAGPPPYGCEGGPGGDGVPSQNLLDATNATEGLFLSICDDWNTTHAKLAARMAGMFPLTDPPLDSPITVTVDGNEIDSGWVYDTKLNAIRFDDDSYPAAGSLVGIEYGIDVVCE